MSSNLLVHYRCMSRMAAVARFHKKENVWNIGNYSRCRSPGLNTAQVLHASTKWMSFALIFADCTVRIAWSFKKISSVRAPRRKFFNERCHPMRWHRTNTDGTDISSRNGSRKIEETCTPTETIAAPLSDAIFIFFYSLVFFEICSRALVVL